VNGFRVDRVELRVADVDRSLEFYGLVTGLETRDGALLDGEGRALVAVASDGVRAGQAPRAATGLFHTALRFSERGALAAAIRRLADAGLRLTGASDHGVSEALYLDDPDGNGVELYWDRAREQWPAPDQPGARVGMFTAPLDVGDLLATPDATGTVDVGHVHLKVADVEPAVGFWTGPIGLDLMTRYGEDAAFVAADGYHHHVGLNSWMSRGAQPGPRELPGLERVVLGYGSADALAAAGERLERAGAAVTSADGALTTSDPDANALRLVVAGEG
jgi:catechol 2,3-dioxygenase